jgi:class 3 adenylate cyclase/predicted ATPase
MTCSRCGTENRTGRRFCSKCGAPLAVACPACGFTNEPGDEYCGGCGQRLPLAGAAVADAPAIAAPPVAAPAAAEAERRQLTVMFCDLVGSTALSGRLDPEELRVHVRGYQEAGAEAIARFGGHIAQYLGDGLLVYWGYPTAHGDDAERAVRAGLAIIDAIGAVNARQPPGGVHLAVRVGIHTGLVVVGEVGAGNRREQLALGEAPNVAARLQTLADPDTVVISGATHRLVERFFTFRALEAKALRGMDTAPAVYEVAGERTRAGDGLTGPAPTPLVGREREVALVLERWEAAADAMGQVVLVSGEAGIGKTRLAETVCERLAGITHARIEGRCSPYRQHSPMHVVIELLQAALGFERDDTVEMLLRRLTRTLAECGLPPAEGVALLAALLGLPSPAEHGALSWTPQRQRQRTIAIALEILLRLSARRPLLLLVEDLHWVDASSLEFLSLLVEQVATAPMCLLLTARPDFRPPWSALSHTIQVTLPRLPRRQTEQMILSVAGGKTLPGEVLQKVVMGADGVPLFVEEITKMVLESGLLRDREARYELTGPLGTLAIPTTLHDSLMARLDRLPEARPVAQLAATIGREFSYELLHEVSLLDESALQRELGRLVEAELLYQRGLPPASTYVFKHALIQEAAYQSLLRSSRQQHHQKIAAVLAERFPQIAKLQPDLMAHHYTEAGLATLAIPCWQAAGEHAVRRSAGAEAIAHFEQALALMPSLPETPDRARQELALLMPLGSVLFGSRGFAAPETERVYARAQELCEQLGDIPEVFPALWGQWGFFNLQGNIPRALEIGDRLLAHARRSGDAGLLLEAHHARWPSRTAGGLFVEALDECEEGIALYDPGRHRALAFLYGGHDARSCSLCFESVIRWVLGYPQQAVERAERGLALARELAHPHTEANARAFTSLFRLLRGDREAARAAAEACQALDAEFGFPQWAGMARVIRGSAMAGLGEAETGLAEMRRGLADWQATSAGAHLPLFMALIADAQLRQGDVAGGLRSVDEGLARVRVGGERLMEAELHRLHGELLLIGGDQSGVDAAEACFQRAIEVSRQQRAKAWELRAASSMARLWERQGRHEDARRLLSEVVGWFTEGLDTPDLEAATDLLDRLGRA